MSQKYPYLNLDGIPSKAPRPDGAAYFSFDPQGIWRISKGSRLHDIEELCVRLHDAFKIQIMENLDYSKLIYHVPQFVRLSGHNSESSLSKELFEQLLQKSNDFPEINRFLYLFDCQSLISSIQECTKEVDQILGEFYLTFNTEGFFYPPMKHEDGIRHSSSPVTTKLFAFLGFLFIRLHSLLDYTVKVSFEAENLRHDFSSYPKLSSKNLQYGDRKKVKFDKHTETLFEVSDFMTAVETLRNHLIHDGLLDDQPKAYERIEGGIAVEKFILFPDMTAGRFDSYKNRKLFFGKEDKFNLRLPDFLAEFQSRQVKTLSLVLDSLSQKIT